MVRYNKKLKYMALLKIKIIKDVLQHFQFESPLSPFEKGDI